MIVIAIMIMMMLMRYRDLNRACDQEQARLGRESVLKDNKTAEIWSKLGNKQLKVSLSCVNPFVIIVLNRFYSVNMKAFKYSAPF